MAAKKKDKGPASVAPAPGADERRAKIDLLVAQAAKTHGEGCVQLASKTHCSYLLRRPTGLTSLDIAMAGGWPAGAPGVLVGPEAAGKDYLLWKTAAEVQRIYGEDFGFMVYFTEFKPDKLYMKDYCGLQIAFSEEELEDMSAARFAAGQPELTSEELDHYRHQVGNIVTTVGISADQGFDEVFNFLAANVCQLISVNSIGFMQTEAKESVDSFEEFAQRSSEATLLSKVMPKIAMYLNKTTNGQANETSIVLLNQVRGKTDAVRPMKGRPVQEKDKYQTAANAFALKHGKALEVFLHNGKVIWDEETRSAIGKVKTWEISKGKLGTHEGIKGEFNYFYGEGWDACGDLVTTAKSYGVIQASGAWHSYEEEDRFKFKCNSEAKAIKMLRESMETSSDLFDHLRMRCFQEAGVLYRHK